MKEKLYTSCQCCSALGLVGERCEFCGNTIVAKQSNECLSAKLVSRRTIPGEKFAEKISKYHDVGDFNSKGIALVSIGDLVGAVNKNGDLVVPLDYEYIFESGDFLMLKPSGEDKWYILDADLEFVVNENGERLASHVQPFGRPFTTLHGQINYRPSSTTFGIWDVQRKKSIFSSDKEITWNDCCYKISTKDHPQGYIVYMTDGEKDFGFGFIHCDGTIVFCDPEIGIFEFDKYTVVTEVSWVRYKDWSWERAYSSRPRFDANVSFEEQFKQLDALIMENEKQVTVSAPSSSSSSSRQIMIGCIIMALSLVIAIVGCKITGYGEQPYLPFFGWLGFGVGTLIAAYGIDKKRNML